MLETHATEFLDYCKVPGFSPRSRQSLEISLRKLAAFIDRQAVDSPEDIIAYGLLAGFRRLPQPFRSQEKGQGLAPASVLPLPYRYRGGSGKQTHRPALSQDRENGAALSRRQGVKKSNLIIRITSGPPS